MHYRWICPIAALLVGCASQPVRYSRLDSDAAIAILRQRASAIHSVTCQCEVTLKRSGQAVHLDGLVVIAPPDRVRMRVWKMDQVVFDLTSAPEGTWIESTTEPGERGPLISANAAQLSQQLSWFVGGFFTEPRLIDERSSGDDFVFRRDQSDGTSVTCDVDAATATARRFTLRDLRGSVRFSLDAMNYRQIQGITWPMRLAAHNSQDSSEMDVDFSNVEFNGELAPRAFVPPASAEKLQ